MKHTLLLWLTFVGLVVDLLFSKGFCYSYSFPQSSKIVQEKVVYTNDPKNANVSAEVWVKNNRTLLNVSAENFIDLDRLILTFVLSIPKNENDKNFDSKIMQSTLSSCKISEGNRGNFIIKMVMEEFEKNADFKFDCPFLKVNDLIMNDNFLIFFFLRKNTA